MQISEPQSDASRINQRRGFSLLELLAVTVIIGIIASVTIPRIGQSASLAKGKVCLQYKADVNTASEKYFIATGDVPKTLLDLQTDDYYGPELPTCPVDGTGYKLDSKTGRVIGHDH